MTIEPVAQCYSRIGWDRVVVPSGSDPRVVYNVWTNPYNAVSEYICECEGYFFRGTCSHQEKAELLRCKWTSIEGPEEQTPEQRRQRVCPRCDGQTQWVMEEIDDE